MKPSIIIIFSLGILSLSYAVQTLSENCKIVATSDTRIDIFDDNHEAIDMFDENHEHTVFRCDGDGFSYGFELPTAENQHMQQLLDTGRLIINESTLLKKADVIVEGNTIMSLGAQPWSFARNEPQERRRSEEGDKLILAVKVIDVNGLAHPDSPTTISDNIFGTNGDPVNLKSQMFACSFGKLNIVNEYSVAIEGQVAAPGVIEVEIPISLTLNDRYTIHDAVTVAVQDKLDLVLPGPFEQVMYVLENCYVGCGWAAYAYINSWMSVYQGSYYAMAGVQMHEIGHNFGFAHSGGLDGQTYTDHTCQMGNPLYDDDIGKMCYNPAKNWAIGWYDSNKIEVNINTNFINHVETIIGIADFAANPEGRNVVIKLETGTSNDYFVGFNRAIGVNAQNDEADDEVTVILTGNNGIAYSQSYLQATLKQGESWERNGMKIKAEEINVSTAPGTAKVSIMKGSSPTNSPIRLPTPPTIPTNSPVKPPTIPTNSPVKAPTSDPLDNYDFYQFYDSFGGDIGEFTGGVRNYAEVCSKNINCLGFNSNGWLKNNIQDRSKWDKWTNNPALGLYVKKGAMTNAPVSPSSPTESPVKSTTSPINSPVESWRIWAKVDMLERGWLWDVHDVRFYSKSDCTGTIYNTGNVISSGYHEYYPASNAFDADMNSRWGGRLSGSPQACWIGMAFASSVDVQCVSFKDLANNGAKAIEVQVLDTNEIRRPNWTTIVRSENLTPGKMHKITLVQVTPTPITPPTNSPNKAPTRSPIMKPTKPPTSAPVTSPTKLPISSPTRIPTASPIHTPQTNPTSTPQKSFSDCTDDMTTRFLYRETKNNDGPRTAIPKSCKWLRKKNIEKRIKICEKKRKCNGDFGSAQSSCPETCEFCGMCEENNNALFFFKIKKDKVMTRKCSWLATHADREMLCNNINQSSCYGIASKVCPSTCFEKSGCENSTA